MVRARSARWAGVYRSGLRRGDAQPESALNQRPQAPGTAAQLRQVRAGTGKVQCRRAAVCAGIEHAALGLQLLQVVGRAVTGQVGGCGAAIQVLGLGALDYVACGFAALAMIATLAMLASK